MANQRVLLAFLTQQANNRAEQIKTHKAYRNPNAQLLGKFRDEHAMFEQVAKIVAAHDFSTVTETSDDFEHQRLSTTKHLVPRDTPLTGNGEPSLANATLEAPKVTANGKRIGRPPKMTMKQIEASRQGGVGVAINDKD